LRFGGIARRFSALLIMSETKPTESMAFYNFLAWLDRNRKAVLLGTLIVLAVVVGAAVMSWKRGQNELAASRALFALPPVVAMRDQARPSPEAYLEVARQHSNTSAADRALLLGAGLLFEQGRFADAQAKFEQFLNENPDSPYQSQAALGVAASLEGQGRAEQAIARYREVITRYPNEPAAPQAKLNLARIYAANQPEEALRLYDELIRPPGTAGFNAWSNEAAERRRRLVQQHPELAAAAAPAPASPLPFTITPAPEPVPSVPMPGEPVPVEPVPTPPAAVEPPAQPGAEPAPPQP
jgi:predicted negative regulator of RcsB-dependent stress response